MTITEDRYKIDDLLADAGLIKEHELSCQEPCMELGTFRAALLQDIAENQEFWYQLNVERLVLAEEKITEDEDWIGFVAEDEGQAEW